MKPLASPERATVAAFVVLVGGWVLFAPEHVLLRLIPDDAFFYPVISHNRLVTGFWSFDGSPRQTFGFHPLQMGWAFIVNWVRQHLSDGQAHPGMETVRVLALLGVFATGLGIWCSAWLLRARSSGVGSASAMATGVTSYVVLGSANMLETGLVLAASMLLYAGWLALVAGADATAGSSHRSRLLVFWLAALVAPLTRADVVILVGALLLTTLWLERRRRSALALVRMAVATALTGVGYLTSLALVRLVTGSWQQDSVAMKRFWMEVYAPGVLGRARSVVLHALDAFTSPLAAWSKGGWVLPIVGLLLGALVLATWVHLRRGATDWWQRSHRIAGEASVSTGVILVAYSSAYGLLMTQTQSAWYYAAMQYPLVVAGCSWLVDAWHHGDGRTPARLTAGAWIGLFLAANLSSTAYLVGAGRWPKQLESVVAGRWLRAECPDRAVGAWNSGIVSYFSQRQVLNLDGLVNPEILVYARTRRVDQYLERVPVACIVDSPEVLRWRYISETMDLDAFRAAYAATPIPGTSFMSVWRRR